MTLRDKLSSMPFGSALPSLALAFSLALMPALAPARQAAAAAAPAPQAPATLDAADLGAWLDGRVPYALKSGNIAGAVVVVVKDGKVLLQKGYGYADVAKKTPMDPETSMIRPGSTSKMFTWTAVMQLVQQGKIDLDRDVNDYLDFKVPTPFGKPITMRDLMNHRGGFEEGLKDVLAYDPKLAQSTEQYLKQHPRPMLFAPGTVPAYSNYGAALAGYIVERVSGEPFDTYIERHLFHPLKMMHSSFAQPLQPAFQPLAAQGYREASDAPSPFELVITRPAGSLTATAADMSRFMLAHLQQGSLDGYAMLDAATSARMFSTSQTSPASPAGFATLAHGLFLEQRNGHTVVGHGGDTIVFHTDLNLLPAEGVGYFVTFNSRGREEAVYGARKELFDGFMDRYFPAPKVVDAPVLATAAADAQRIAGRYQSSRRIEHGFLSVLYLLSQTVITANPDGTISAPGGPSGEPTVYREVGPQLWRKAGSSQALLLTEVNDVKTVIDSENPVSVLHPASALYSAPLNLSVMAFSVFIMLASLVCWPLGALLRRADQGRSNATPALRRLRLFQRLAVLVAALYLLAWYVLIKPVLNVEVAFYHSGMDWIVGLMEASGLLAIAAALVALWAAWRMFGSAAAASGATRFWGVLVALALLGVIWVAAIGKLISWNLNY